MVQQLRRCYNKKSKGYSTYGAKGVHVCDEWLYFSNFKKWFDENYVDGLCIDKDIKNILDENGNRYYSPESCIFVTHYENNKERSVRVDNSGENNVNSYPMEYYSNNPVPRRSFKRACFHKKWNFYDFKEKDSFLKNKYGVRLFLYKYSPETNNIENLSLTKIKIGEKHHNSKEMSYYENNATTRGHFKKSCKSKGWIYSDFIEKYSGIKTNCNHKMFYYIYSPKTINIPVKNEKKPIKGVEYYIKTEVRKDSFKNRCKINGWDFDSFIEVFSGNKDSSNRKLYYYICYETVSREKEYYDLKFSENNS